MSKQITLKINGMNCGGCAMNIRQALRNVEGVESADVSLESKTAVIQLGEKPPSVDKLIKAVKRAGYEASPTA